MEIEYTPAQLKSVGLNGKDGMEKQDDTTPHILDSKNIYLFSLILERNSTNLIRVGYTLLNAHSFLHIEIEIYNIKLLLCLKLFHDRVH